MKKIWVVVISVVVTAVIVGGGVYWYEKNKADKDKAALNTQISDLNARITDLASQTADATATKAAADAAAAKKVADDAAAAATTAANAWKNYTNADYGFHLTFTDGWTGYRVKKVALEGLVAAYYINMPTTDPLYAAATNSSYGGYAAPFCIGIMNKSEWTGDELQVRDFGSKLGENSQYVFTGATWQDSPTDLRATIASTVTAVMSSFAL